MKKGSKHTIETRLKMSISSSSRIRLPFSDATKEKLRKQKLGEKNPMWGKPVSEKHMIAFREISARQNAKNWIEDRAKLKRYGDDNKDRRSYAYKAWRRTIWRRDAFRCKISNMFCSGRIEAHHILGYKEHPELRYEINNGITLCHAHHPRRKSEEKRLSPFFAELTTVSKTLL